MPRRVVRPLERFLKLESGSAALLMAAAVAALIWTNAAGGSYDDFWSTEVNVELGPLELHEDLRHIVNDLLMAVFFYVVSLEVKREFLFGALRERASAAVPVAAALGTMVGGAVVYLVVNLDGGEPGGWAVPIATDIAFAVGVLGLAGRRAPQELRAFLLTLAVVDDLGTIAVIGVFYSLGPGARLARGRARTHGRDHRAPAHRRQAPRRLRDPGRPALVRGPRIRHTRHHRGRGARVPHAEPGAVRA